MKKLTLALLTASVALLSACSSDSGSGNPLNSGTGIITVPDDGSELSTSTAE